LVTPTRTRWRSPSERTDLPAGADLPRHAPTLSRQGACPHAVAQTLTISLSVLDHTATPAPNRPQGRPRAASQRSLTHASQLVKELPETALTHAPRPKNERRGDKPPRQVQPGRIAGPTRLSTCAASLLTQIDGAARLYGLDRTPKKTRPCGRVSSFPYSRRLDSAARGQQSGQFEVVPSTWLAISASSTSSSSRCRSPS